jgi:hypothetical protein
MLCFPDAATTQCRVYAVTNGETLLDVAGRFGIRDIAGLMAANNMKTDADAVLVVSCCVGRAPPATLSPIQPPAHSRRTPAAR